MKILFATLILLWAAHAQASGSSTVFADSKYFRVAIESVRKIFAHSEENPNQEGDWHAEWRKQNQPRVNRLRARLDPDFPSLVETYGLVPFKAGYPEVEEGNEEDRGEILKSKKPFQYRLRFNDVYVSVAFTKLPPASARRALRAALQRHLPRE